MEIEGVLEKASRMFPTLDQPPFLIDPPRQPYTWDPDDWDDWGPPEWLPKITCIADFTSHGIPERYPGSIDSSLTVVWFQDEYALPISDLALEQIKSIDWDENAVGYDDP